jgi:hypothetical protein
VALQNRALPSTIIAAASPMARTRKANVLPRNASSGADGSKPAAINARHNANTGESEPFTVMPNAVHRSLPISSARMARSGFIGQQSLR